MAGLHPSDRHGRLAQHGGGQLHADALVGLGSRLVDPEKLGREDGVPRQPGVACQIEQHVERGEQAVRARERDIGEVIRQRALVRAGFAEHRRNQRRIGVDIRRGDEDFRRFQIGQIAARAQQRIAQHFEFAQTRMADMHAQRGIIERSARPRCAQFVRIEVANAFLQRCEACERCSQRHLIAPVTHVDAHVTVRVRQREEIERGQVLAKPASITPHVTFLCVAQAGR